MPYAICAVMLRAWWVCLFCHCFVLDRLRMLLYTVYLPVQCEITFLAPADWQVLWSAGCEPIRCKFSIISHSWLVCFVNSLKPIKTLENQHNLICSFHISHTFQDYTGAFKCMVDGDNRIAWVKQTTPVDYNEENPDNQVTIVSALLTLHPCLADIAFIHLITFYSKDLHVLNLIN